MTLKPEIRFTFHDFGVNSIWLAYDFKEAKTFEDLTDVFHKWITVAEENDNEVKRRNYKVAAYVLYSKLTNRSYESWNWTKNN